MADGADREVGLIPLDYLILRVARRFAPQGLVDLVLKRRWGVVPGTETTAPSAAARRYQEALAQGGRHLAGASVFVLGFGGYYGLAVELLRAGARHVAVCDPYATPKPDENAVLAQRNPGYFQADGISPRPEYIATIDEDVRRYVEHKQANYDLVLSWSVFEHLDDPPSILAALSRLTDRQGFNIHFIDLRDHFFKYPFEMYCHADAAWRRWMNPSSNLNRWRLWQYQTAFQAYFERVRIFNLESEVQAFLQQKDRIRDEFKSGDDSLDAVTRIQISAYKPRRLS